ncbi:MAG: hypothetical protein J6P30_06705 [Fibrobacter sp.]|nr:hypothetical protein [Fibrobacter sp.]
MQKYLKIAFFAFASAILVACSNSVDPSDSGSGDIGKISEPAEETSSSSIMEESSSSGIPSSLTDPRDGQIYKVVTIGTQIWMAENLNYKMDDSYCYKNDDKNCSKYGRLYKWESAQKACPTGWHLPTKAEFDELTNARLGGGRYYAAYQYSFLTSQDYFIAILAGFRKDDGTYSGENSYARFWSSSEYDGEYDDIKGTFYTLYLNGSSPSVSNAGYDLYLPNNALSVRCIFNKSAPNDNKPLETFTDSRDGKTYKMVKIGEQTWMAENLNYQTETSFCYNDDTTQCSVFGHYYSRAEALNACPDGWHLPSNEEWDTLIAEVGGPDSANAKLRSTNMWALSSGTDEFSFKVLPSGYCQTNSNGTKGCSSVNDNFHYYATIWSSDVFLIDEHALFTTEYYYYLEIGGSNTRLARDFYKSYHRNIRCIKGSKTSSSSATISNFPIVEPCKTESEDHCEYGTLTDKRDGQTYKTVKIGEQWWMAENLDYAYLQPTADLDSSSFYYDDNVLLGHKYDPETESYLEFPLKPVGRLYLWSAAMDSAGLWSTGSKGCGEGSRCTATFPVQGVCPEGWHLPTRAEFDTLIAAVGGENIAGKALKSSVTRSSDEGFFGEEGVTIWGNSKGSDAYGFAVCPSGQRCPYNYCGGEGSIYGSIDGEYINASFWTSSELDSTHASFMLLRPHDAASLVTYRKGNALSIRCIKD